MHGLSQGRIRTPPANENPLLFYYFVSVSHTLEACVGGEDGHERRSRASPRRWETTLELWLAWRGRGGITFNVRTRLGPFASLIGCERCRLRRHSPFKRPSTWVVTDAAIGVALCACATRISQRRLAGTVRVIDANHEGTVRRASVVVLGEKNTDGFTHSIFCLSFEPNPR